ncbi:MAG TPA: hypothetical protein VKB05_14050 [Pyrinomonadaceae bacterium]|nr:hypothetical protein [Pyrinomonadaceae bacterium]
MLAKLKQVLESSSYKSPWLSAFGAKRNLQGFLARRCSKEFLSLYLQHNPNLLEQVSEPGLFLDTVPEVRLAKRLHEFGLLPEAKRKRFVETVSHYALEGQDADALDDDRIRSLFTDEEFEELVLRVRTELLPRLGDVRREWESNHSLGDPPEEHMQQLLELFDSLKGRFSYDETALNLIQSQVGHTNDWIEENTPAEPERSSRTLGSVDSPEKPRGSRSIFDDIDADT